MVWVGLYVVTVAALVTMLVRLRRRVAGLAQRLAEQQRMEEALQHSEERFRRFSEAAFEGILIHDRGVIQDANEALARMFGYQVEEMIGRSALDFLTAKSREIALERIESAHDQPYELVGIHRSGATFPIEVCGKTMTWQGRSLRVVAVRDITERKRLEEQLREAQKMEAIGRLAGGVAHDFNNLLTVIGGYSQMLMADLPEDHPHYTLAQEIFRASERAAALAGQLLAFGRRQIMQPRVINLNQLVADLHKLLRRVIGEDIELATALSPDLGNVMADPGQIEQVIVNLAVNARDAMPHGGRLTLSTANVDLTGHPIQGPVTELSGPFVVLAVEDTGCGMDEATRRRIFEPFFTTKPPGQGAGLGLSTVYGIVRQHGGAIGVESTPGRGTTFRIYLPRVQEAPAPSPEIPSGGPPGGNETILLVEDEASVRRLVRRSLEQLGYTVLEADGHEAARALCLGYKDRIHLLVTDVIMPKVSGRQLAASLLELRPELKVLYLSGYSEEQIARARVLEAGLNFLAKPFTLEALARKVREVLDG